MPHIAPLLQRRFPREAHRIIAVLVLASGLALPIGLGQAVARST